MSTPAPYLSLKTVTVPSMGTLNMPITGTMFFVKTATFPFTMNFDGGEDLTVSAGWNLTMPSGYTFKAVIIKNLTGTPLTTQFYAGSVGVNFVPPTLFQDAPTFASGSDVQALDGQANFYLAGYVGNVNRRRQLMVTNLDLALPLYVCAGLITLGAPTGNGVLAAVLPRSVWTMATDASLSILNPAAPGNAVSCIVGQTFYQ